MASARRPEPAVELPGEALASIGHDVILDALSDAIVAADDGNRIVYCNPAAENLLGWPAGELRGHALVEIVPPQLRDAHLDGFARFLRTGTARLIGTAVRVPALHRDGHEIEVELTLSAFEAGEGRRVFVASLRDLSDRVQLERQQAMTSYFRATSDVAVLLGLSGTVHTLEGAAPLVLEAIGTSLGWQLGALWLVADDGETLCCQEVWCAPGVDAEEFTRLTRVTTFARGTGLPGEVWEREAPVWVEDLAQDERYPRSTLAKALGLHAGFAFPIMSEGRFLGAIDFFHGERKPVDADLVGVVATIGGQLAQFLERRRAEQEVRESGERFAALAQTLQASLLPPHLPEIPGLEVGGRYRPAGRGAEVGGDFYDLFPVRGTAWGVVMGDVCGKGAEAATVTAFARYTLRAAVMRTRRPRNVLAVLNEAMNRHEAAGRFITVAFATVRPADGHADVVVSLGGHPPPVVLRADGSARVVGRPGTILGILENPALYDHAVHLNPGDALVFYTDGVTEARRGDEQFGEERLLQAVQSAAGLAADAVAATVEGAVDEFRTGEARDDLAILVVRVPSGGSGI
ncbi:MAG TPA: SpoIIE family protein phosphatase [Acidimicrobiales bacterium]|nr:SpoIIE family protein phosphatase [Acidimicrobiales bacterium]